MYFLYVFSDHCGSTCFTFYDNFLKWQKPGVGRECLFMFLQGIVYFGIVILAEYGIFQRLWNSITSPKPTTIGHSQVNLQGAPIDSDVTEEEKRISDTPVSSLQDTDALILKVSGR